MVDKFSTPSTIAQFPYLVFICMYIHCNSIHEYFLHFLCMLSIIDSNCFVDFSYLSRLLRTEAVKFKGDMASLFAGM
jgi:hypothetical protein